MCETIKTTVRRIRKARNCFGCCKRQPQGAKMQASLTRGDGHIYTIYLCARCQEVEAAMDWRDYPFFEGDLRDE